MNQHSFSALFGGFFFDRFHPILIGEHMKITRFLSFLLMVAFALAVLIPTEVYAYPAMPGGSAGEASFAQAKPGTLIVNNVSGGTLRVSLSGSKSYYFSTAKAGTSQFTGIEPGRYTIKLSATTCTDVVTVAKKIDTNAKVTLKEKVCEKKASKDKDKNSQKTGSLTVTNKTGGTLYITLKGLSTFYFNAPNQGKTVFKDIQSGKYEITVRSSGCSGSLSYSKKIDGNNVSLPPFVCR
jgi:hypothetical protein